MTPLFIDTAGWVMLVDSAERRHADAVECRDRHLLQGGTLVTSDYVVDETLTLLRMRMGLSIARRWWVMASGSRRLRFESIDADRLQRARDWFFGWDDKSFSFTDCTSFVVMRELGIRAALTSDSHFVQAGFEVVP